MTATAVDTRGRVLPITRVGIWVLFVLAALNGLFLYFAPAQAELHYAWSIKPPINAAFIGAGFLAGTLATGLVLRFATRWRTFSTLPIALWVLATTLFVATMIHHDRFKFGYPPTWVWTAVYAGVPFAVPYLVWRQNRRAEPKPEADPRLNPLRVISGVVGILILLGAIALYVAPVDVGKHWLWPLTPLLARAVASWYALFGTMLVSCAVGLRRRSEALIPYATLLCWCVLVLLIAPLNSGDVTGGGPWYTGMVALGLFASYGLRVAWPERTDL